VALTEAQLRDLIADLVNRPGHEKVRGHVQNLLVLHLGAKSSDVNFEQQLVEVRGRIDALLGRTIFEFKSDLRKEQQDAETQLAKYLEDREKATGYHYVGIATDGATFVPYEIRRGKLLRLREFKLVRGDTHGLPLWLTPFVALAPEKKPDPQTVREELGRESLVYEVARGRISELWDAVKHLPDVLVKRKLWADRLQVVYGSDVDDDALFFQHTYLTIVAKTMATLVLGVEIPEARDLLSGVPFRDAGIDGVVESDFFDWVLEAPASTDLIRQIAGQVAAFKLGDIEHDVLKGLYESLIDPEQRHYLGEYYTPDWLAQWICERAIDKPLDQRVLDPACGSGSFLFHAVRRFLAAADQAGLKNKEAVERCTQRVLGIDVHPVAVINARITYLLALGERRLLDRPSLSIPVYLGDSLQWNTTAILNGQEVRIEVPEEGTLLFPVSLAKNPTLFDAVVSEMLKLSESGAKPADFEVWLKQQPEDEFSSSYIRSTLVATYSLLERLRREQKNHIWGYVARNLSRPAWLSSSDEKVEVLVGNPPWLAYRDMSEPMQKRLKQECIERGLWTGGKVATHQDLSAYFFARTVELYLKPRGKIAFVMPYATMSRQQYAGFRSGRFVRAQNKRKETIRVLSTVRFTDAWVFDESVQPLFNVPSCVLFGEARDAANLPAKVTAFEGHLPKRDASAQQAAHLLKRRTISWPESAEQATSAYGERFHQGATIVPRLFFVVVRSEGRFGPNPSAPIVESRKSSQEKKPWRDLPALRGPIEKPFLRRLYLGESIAPFRLLAPAEAIIPWDNKIGLLDAKTAQPRATHLPSWLKKAEELWQAHGRGSMTLSQRIDFQHELASQFPAPKFRVVYSKAGVLPAAAILKDKGAVIDHKLYWASATSEEEARFLLAFLNSEFLRKRVAPRQSRGQWGARDFDKLLADALPQFEPSSVTHKETATAVLAAEQLAKAVTLPDGIHFIRARQRIRTALHEDGIGERIEKLVAKVLA
jgi:hypothetical protein